MSAAPLARPSIVVELARALRSRILSGELGAGMPLREEALAGTYGVSRHTLRAAFRLLASEGLVQIVPNRGSIVARLSDADLVPLFELRSALEVEACRLALERNGGKLPAEVHAALAALVRACRAKGNSWRDVADAHASFHGSLVAAAESPRIDEAYGRLAAELSVFLLQLQPVWSRRRMIEHHRELVAALESTGDLGALRRHLVDGLDAVRRAP